MAATVEVRLLGRVEVLVDGARVEVPGRRPRALLAVLALSAGEAVPAEALYERVWGHNQPGDVRANLYTCVRRLRRALGEESIVNDAGRYSLQVGPEAVDAVCFVRLVESAGTAGADAEVLLREALALWRGQPFGDEQLSDWLAETESPRLTERWLAAVQARIDLDLAAGRSDDLVGELEALTAAYPLREPLWARYLIVLTRGGRPADALAAYERIRVRLVDELGIDPSPELQSLYAALLRGESPQVVDTATGAAAKPRQLPSAVAGFTGRDSALGELDQLLGAGDEGDQRSVVIAALHGLGGVGKTTLAVHWANRVADRFPDGQLFVNLNGYGPSEPMQPVAALDVLLRGVGVPGDRIPADLDSREGLWRSAVSGKRLLLVLDNARDAEQVRPLLPGTGCLVVVTSRSQLRGLAAREGAHRVALDVLLESESVSLLTKRLKVETLERSAVIELAELCGHLPLALAVAAERANRWPEVNLADLLAELRDEHDRLEAFADPDDPLADVRAVLGWSFHALDDTCSRLLSLVSVAPGGDISTEATAALCAMSLADTRRVLDRLVDASLVSRSGHARFELHDLVRAYAAERVAESEADDALDRLYRWCLRTMTNARLVLNPRMSVLHPAEPDPIAPDIEFQGDQEAAEAWIDRETSFLIAVVYAARDTHPWVVIGVAHALPDEIRWSRSWDEIVALNKLGRQAARQLGAELAEARALNSLGLVYRLSADLKRAAAAYEEAFGIFERIGATEWLSRVLNNLGTVMCNLGRPLRAAEYHKRALGLALHHGTDLEVANARGNHAFDLSDLALHDLAVEEAEQALLLYRRLNDVLYEAYGLEAVGCAQHARGSYAAAIESFEDALRLHRGLKIPQHHTRLLASLARSQHAAGRQAEARFTLQGAISMFDEHNLIDSVELRRADMVELLSRVTHLAQAR